jgi:hypothetical protein
MIPRQTTHKACNAQRNKWLEEGHLVRPVELQDEIRQACPIKNEPKINFSYSGLLWRFEPTVVITKS